MSDELPEEEEEEEETASDAESETPLVLFSVDFGEVKSRGVRSVATSASCM